MTKRELLIAICENPGWAPDGLLSLGSSEERALSELITERWIENRLDGYEATPHALVEFPDFPSQEDIRDPEWKPADHMVHNRVEPERGVHEVGLRHSLVLGNAQQISSPIDVSFGSAGAGNTLKGGITLELAGVDPNQRVEVEVRLRVRHVPTVGGG